MNPSESAVPTSPGPLEGIRILDLTTVVLGPYATQVLADLGADVIKVEPPGGDVLRHVGPMRNPRMGHLFLNANRNKRSIALDLKRSEARVALLRVAETADVLVHNVRPQAMARLGLSYEDLAAANPRLIYAAAVGFGAGGRYAGKPAYDDLIQGATGLAAVMGAALASEPRYVPCTMADRVVGLYLANAISAALVYRERTGHGQSVEIPMFEAFSQFVLGDHLAGLSFDPPAGPPHYARLMTPQRRPYATRDGHLCVLIYNDKQWASFFRLIGREDLIRDPRFVSHEQRAAHIDAVYTFVAEVMRSRTSAEWTELLSEADIPVMPVNTIETLIEDPHLNDVGFIRRTEHPTEGTVLTTGPVGSWSGSHLAIRHPAPLLGQHGAEILREAGLTPDAIARALRPESNSGLSDDGPEGPN